MSVQILNPYTGAEKVLPPINYIAFVTEYSWWCSRLGKRKFVVVRVRHEFADTACKEPPRPTMVELLEVDKTDAQLIPWQSFIQLVEQGELIKQISNQST